ncbi:MAG: histidine phosphatase family protein [Verrucomicrobiota bacterium]|nr:histidine phosphatase family protein [Verrucomicrobiota bacterium]
MCKLRFDGRMRLHIIRHGDPDYSIDSLTAKGHTEAKALAGFLSREKVNRLFSSPLGRARHTALYTAEALGLPIEIEDWTREINELKVPAQGLMAWDMPGSGIRAAAEGNSAVDWATHPDFSDIPYAEVQEKLAEASDAFLTRLGYQREGSIYRVMQRHEETIALFCHGGFGLTWLAHLLAIPAPLVWSGFFLHPSSITTILWDERSPGVAVPRCLWVGALPHLAVAGIEPSPSGIKANYR